MTEIHEKEPKIEESEDVEVELIEPKTSVLDAVIDSKANERDSRKKDESETEEIFDAQNYGKYIIEPIVGFLNGLIEKTPAMTEISTKQENNLKRDFNKMVNGFGKDNPLMKFIRKAATSYPYLPFLITLGGIGAQKGYEVGKYKKKEKGNKCKTVRI